MVVSLRMYVFHTLLASILAVEARSSLSTARLVVAMASGKAGSPPRVPGGRLREAGGCSARKVSHASCHGQRPAEPGAFFGGCSSSEQERCSN